MPEPPGSEFLEHFLKFAYVGSEVADAFGCFFGGHGIFVELIAEAFLVE